MSLAFIFHRIGSCVAPLYNLKLMEQFMFKLLR